MQTPRVLVVPGGTSVGAAALAYASLSKLAEQARTASDGAMDEAPSSHKRTVVVMHPPSEIPHTSLRHLQTDVSHAFPELPEDVRNDPALLDGIDVVIPTSGSSTGTPHLVGLSTEALIASVHSTHAALEGPGRWILALPAHHIAGAQVLMRSAVAGFSPMVVDTDSGFRPADLLSSIAGATQDSHVPGYLSLVPVQLRACLDAGEEVIRALASLAGVLVGGSSITKELLQAARNHGIRVVTTYGMTETGGGCVYNSRPLPGVTVRAVDVDGQSRLAIAGPMLMTKYLDGPSPFIDEGGARWLLTGDIGRIASNGDVQVLGRSDDVIVTGGLSVAPGPVRDAVLSAPGVRDSWILDLEDERWGHVVTAAVVRDSSHSADLDSWARSIRDHVGARLGRAQAPRVVVPLHTLPMLESGKVDRSRVRALVMEQIEHGEHWRR